MEGGEGGLLISTSKLDTRPPPSPKLELRPWHYNPQSAATATNPQIYKFIRDVGKYGSSKYGIKCF